MTRKQITICRLNNIRDLAQKIDARCLEALDEINHDPEGGDWLKALHAWSGWTWQLLHISAAKTAFLPLGDSGDGLTVPASDRLPTPPRKP